jgi:hypothetical protein
MTGEGVASYSTYRKMTNGSLLRDEWGSMLGGRKSSLFSRAYITEPLQKNEAVETPVSNLT